MAPDDPRHGTHNGYNNLRCRCTRCRAAHRDAFRRRRARARAERTCPTCEGPGGLAGNHECDACRHYRQRHGVRRPPEVIDPIPRAERCCGNCGRVGVHALDRCVACHRYLLRTGVDRPARLYARGVSA